MNNTKLENMNLNLDRYGIDYGWYNADQEEMIIDAIEEGINPRDIIIDNEGNQLNGEQTEAVLDAIRAGVDLKYIRWAAYDAEQMSEITEGIIAGVDVELYADPENCGYMMREIREFLEEVKAAKELIETAEAEKTEEAIKAASEAMETIVWLDAKTISIPHESNLPEGAAEKLTAEIIALDAQLEALK